MEVTREIVLPASPGEVWEALTDPEQLEQWFANDVELDLEPGGAGAFRWDDGDVRLATVVEVDEGRRLSFRWTDGDGSDEALVELELEEAGEGTRVLVTETPVAPESSAGWAWALQLRSLAALPLAG